jgi:hypothetical protein
MALPTGVNGVDGNNSFTVTTEDFTQPAVGSNVTVDISNTGQNSGQWPGAGQRISILDSASEGGDYLFVSLVSPTRITVQNAGGPTNSPPSTIINTGAKVSPTGQPGQSGTSGLNLLSGSGAPGSGVGVDGELYVDTAGAVLYGPKAAGVWPTPGVSLVGPPGASGTSIIHSAGAQGPQTGAIGSLPLRPAFTIAPGTWLQSNGDVAKFVAHIEAFDPASFSLLGSAAPFRIYVTANSGEITTPSNNGSLFNPLGFVLPLPSRGTGSAFGANIAIEVTIRRISATSASVAVIVSDNIGQGGRSFLSNVSAVTWGFAANTSIGLFSEVQPSGTLTGGVRFTCVKSWVETYKSS